MTGLGICLLAAPVRPRLVTFDDLDLLPTIREAIRTVGYTTPTPVQQAAIPPALEGRDVLGCAQTGTGKTAAFALPILQHVDRMAGDEPAIRALIVTPTRELAAQIGDSFATYGKGLDLWHTVIFGGVSQKPQVKELRRGVDILVATPGRLLDLMGQGFIKLNGLRIFVLDEADRMLDMGFLPDVRRIIAELPATRQTLFFSATMPPTISGLANSLLRNPVSVSVAPISSAAETVVQHVFFVDKSNKRRLLVDILRRPDVRRALVFSRTKHGANRIVKELDKAGVGSAAIHGNKSQNARERALSGFKDGTHPVLVATDIAARGIDVEGVDHVINFDLPNVPETYVHRIGRTGRAGASGIALSLCDVEEREYLIDIERLIGKHLNRVEDHGYPPEQPLPPETDLKSHRPRRASRPPGRRPGGRRGGGGGRPRGGPRGRGRRGPRRG